MPFVRPVLFLAIIVGALAAMPALSGPGPAEAQTPGTIQWKSCSGGFQCGTLDVPLDYAKPDGEQIELSLVRLPARNQGQRIGSLLANPGGPGASGNEFVRFWARALDSKLRDRFDIVGWDPRGVGESEGLTCTENIGTLYAQDPSPDTQAEWDALAREYRALADNCKRKHGDLLQHVGTYDTARDLDRIRAALGDEKLTYVGYSYGTVIGQVYADLFPKNVRALVLDGAVDLSVGPDEGIIQQAKGFELALKNFADDCDARARCKLKMTGGSIKAFDELFKKAEERPIPAKSANRPAGPGEVMLGVIRPLYSEQAWPALEDAVDDALNGDGSGIVRLADDYLERKSDGTYNGLLASNTAINCVDYPASKLPVDFRAYPAAAQRFAELAPHFGNALANGLTCAAWPAEPVPLKTPRGAGAPPIVVVSTSGDPATPYEWGVALSRQLESGTLISFGGEGHTAYGGGDRCVDGAVNAYLLELTVPEKDLRCGDVDKIPASVAVPSTATPAPGGQGAQVPSNPATPAPDAQPPADEQALPPANDDDADGGSLRPLFLALFVGAVPALLVAALAAYLYGRNTR